jgi:formate hydrogenlyase transcriptional activator
MAEALHRLLGSSLAIRSIRQSVEQVADTNATVLLLGETGTGKEVIARRIHHQSRRSTGPYIAANCGGVSASLAASDLFGHEAGAFTNAIRRRVGRFEAANGGTLFLDEIGELPLEIQPFLLRALEEKTIERVGGDPFAVNVRIIAATNRNLFLDVQARHFRADLFYRLNIFPITVPPLRDRREDIAELTGHFVQHFAQLHHRSVTQVSSPLLERLAQYNWPGNIRELRNVIERAVIVSRGSDLEIDPDWLTTTNNVGAETGRTWAAQEKTRILEALRATGGRIYGPGGAAHRLGLRPTTLYGKMRKHGITKNPADWQ